MNNYYYLSFCRRRKNQDMCGAGVLGSGKLAVAGRLAEPLVGRELVRHQPETRVRLHGHQAGRQNRWDVTGPIAHLTELLGSLLQRFLTE